MLNTKKDEKRGRAVSMRKKKGQGGGRGRDKRERKTGQARGGREGGEENRAWENNYI